MQVLAGITKQKQNNTDKKPHNKKHNEKKTQTQKKKKKNKKKDMEQQRLMGVVQIPQLPLVNYYEQNVNTAQILATQEPKRVAQVVKNWEASEG